MEFTVLESEGVSLKMKSVKLFHNPTAGEGEHSRETLIQQIESAGYDCSYSSTKKDGIEETTPKDADIIVAVGGDGTVRKIAAHLLEQPLREKSGPIGLLPLGTANNIARTLGIKGTNEEIIGRWAQEKIKPFDIGRITGLEKNSFLLESLGFGVFPKLIREMRNRKEKSDDPEEELLDALQRLYDIILDYKTRECRIVIGNQEFHDKFLMVEIMNIHSLGPNVNLAPLADPADGELDVILVPASQRKELAAYIERRLKYGKDEPFLYKAHRAKNIRVNWSGHLLHVDDETVKIEKSHELSIEVVQGVLEFLV
ncbi:MAG TPA: diacylglycerol kinase family protein [Cyclobacteriaceae bacterium]